MEYDEIVRILAPCGLSCTKCLAYKDGEIRAASERLIQLLGSFDRYARRFASFQKVFSVYPQFRELLEHFSTGDCAGCRSGACRYPGCVVPACTRDRGVDFCFQCSEFPCGRTTFDADLKRRWVEMNTAMKEKGTQRYYEETKDLPRYW